MTVRDLIQDALREIRVLGAVDAASPEDAALGLRTLQLMVDSAQATPLLLFTVTTQAFTLTANQQVHTIGDGTVDFDINSDRPILITHLGLIPAGDTLQITLVPYPNRSEWVKEPDKTATDTYPYRYLYEPTYPNGTFTFWPIQTSAPIVNISWPSRLTTPATLDTALAFPPGYEEAWKLNLARRLCRAFGKAVSADLKQDADDALTLIKTLNDPGPPPLIDTDPCLRGRGHYDIQINRFR